MNNPGSSSIKTPDLTKVKNHLLESISRAIDTRDPNMENRREMVTQFLIQAYQATKLQLPVTIRDQLFHEVLDELLGFGPLQPLLDDPDISEIMVNGPKKIFIERKGKLTRTNVTFENDAEVLKIIDRIILPLGRRIDFDSPTVDARLPDGSRVNAVIPPVAIDGPTITIRKFQKGRLSVDELIEYDSITPTMAEFVKTCVLARLNIVISGGTGSGKTTLLNVLSSFIPDGERIITIEDAAELQLQQDHVLRMETKPTNSEGKYGIAIRDLVRNSLRMRPDRIVIGECRGGEALDMLQAMNTGHDGSLTTVHSNSPRDAISRLETLCMMAGMDLPVRFIRQQIASAVDVIIQISRVKDGSRKVTSITEVSGMEGETVVMTEIFRFDQTGVTPEGKVQGEMKPSGIRPFFSERLESAGLKLGPEVFGASISGMLNTRRNR
ncbi:MAG: CpaF family protein [Anaerolineaceae bacterium]|nr:CpaF family protein [Anaerolineaceae bacterium]